MRAGPRTRVSTPRWLFVGFKFNFTCFISGIKISMRLLAFSLNGLAILIGLRKTVLATFLRCGTDAEAVTRRNKIDFQRIGRKTLLARYSGNKRLKRTSVTGRIFATTITEAYMYCGSYRLLSSFISKLLSSSRCSVAEPAAGLREIKLDKDSRTEWKW